MALCLVAQSEPNIWGRDIFASIKNVFGGDLKATPNSWVNLVMKPWTA